MKGQALKIHQRVLFRLRPHLVEALDFLKLVYEILCLFDLLVPVLYPLNYSRERCHKRCYRRTEDRRASKQRNFFFRESPAAPVASTDGFGE